MPPPAIDGVLANTVQSGCVLQDTKQGEADHGGLLFDVVVACAGLVETIRSQK